MGVDASSLSGRAAVPVALQSFQSKSPEEVQQLLRRYRNKVDTFAVDQAAFAAVLGAGEAPGTAASVFGVFDTDNDGLIDVLEAMVGLALVSRMTPEQAVAGFAHALFDFDDSGTLSFDELAMVLRTACSAARKIDPRCTEADIALVEEVAAEIFGTATSSVMTLKQPEAKTSHASSRGDEEALAEEDDDLDREISSAQFLQFLHLARATMAPGAAASASPTFDEGKAADLLRTRGSRSDLAAPHSRTGPAERGSAEEKEAVARGSQRRRCLRRVADFLVYWSRAVEKIEALESESDGWTDPDFPPAATSIYLDPARPPVGMPPPACIQWIRAAKLASWKAGSAHANESARSDQRVFVGHRLKGHIIRGALDDDWFLGACAVIAYDAKPHEQGFRDLFVETGQESHGRYCVRFFKDAAPVRVYIDDHIPCDASGQPLFAHSDQREEIWPMLLEKAYAKLHGCYENLAGGDLEYALKDVTGRFVHTLSLGWPGHRGSVDADTAEGARSSARKPATNASHSGHRTTRPAPDSDAPFLREEEAAGSMWELLNEAFRAGHLVAGIRQRGRAMDSHGIETGRPYVVVDTFQALPHEVGGAAGATLPALAPVQLLRLKNAWGAKVWRGAWSQGSPQWKAHPSILREVSLLDRDSSQALHSAHLSSTGISGSTNAPGTGDSAAGTSDDGVFWMSAVDFCRIFSAAHVCGRPPDSPGQIVNFEGEWDPAANTAGGSWLHHQSWLSNPQFALDLQGNGELMISLRQLPDVPYREPRTWRRLAEQGGSGRSRSLQPVGPVEQAVSTRATGSAAAGSPDASPTLAMGAAVGTLGAAGTPIPPGVGFIVLAHSFTPGSARPNRLALKPQSQHPSADPQVDLQLCTEYFVRGRSVDKISYVPGGQYVIVPMLASPGVAGRFVLTVGSTAPFSAAKCADASHVPAGSGRMDSINGGSARGAQASSTSSSSSSSQKPRLAVYQSMSSAAGNGTGRDADAALQHLQGMVDMLRHELGSMRQQRDRMATQLALLD